MKTIFFQTFAKVCCLHLQDEEIP